MILGLDTETQLKYQEAKLTGKKCNQTINLVSMQVYEDEDDYTNLTVKHNDNKGVYISNQLLSNQDISVDSINMDDLKLKFYLPVPMYDASGITQEEKQTRDFLYNLGFTTKRINKSFYMTYIKNSILLGVLGIVLLEVFIEFVIRIHIYSLIIPVTKMLILLFFMAAFIIEFFIPTLIQMIMKKSKGTVMNR